MDKDIFLFGLNHKTASVEVREAFALKECQDPDDIRFPLGGPLKEVMFLSTCNRVEIIAVGNPDTLFDHVICQWAGLRCQSAEDLAPYVYSYRGLEAVRHLFTVASSLDSMVVGEPQILGQLKQAYQAAIKQHTTRVVLNRLLHKAFSVAKRVRTETAIGASAVSISYAAVELAKRIFGDMHENAALLIGAGEMAELAATHLLQSGVQKIYVANRTFARAEELAKQFKGIPLAFEELFDRLDEVDIVISSTGAPNAIIRAKDIKSVLKRRKNKPMFFIDIAVPRDIDPDVNNLDNVYLYDIDDLKEVVEENLANRRGEAARAEAIVSTETDSFGAWLRALDLKPTIVDLLDQGRDIASKELAKTLKRLGPEVSPETCEALDVLANSLVQKLYHEPITFLRRRACEEDSAKRYIDVTRRMFNLDHDTVPPDAHQDRKTSATCDEDIPEHKFL